MNQLDRIIAERPSFHSLETEINRPFQPSESFLPAETAQNLVSTSLTCYGIGADVLSFIAATVGEGSRTLETGAGCSTLVFGIQRSFHIAITPSISEIERIQEYARRQEVHLDRVQFIPEASEQYLPRSDATGLDLVLLDGKHAFPWPIVDWFFTADRLRQGGVMIIDDVQLRAVNLLVDFMRVDPGWEMAGDFSGKTLAFKKTRPLIHDVAWHMQPWNAAAPALGEPPVSLFRKVVRRLKRSMMNRGDVVSRPRRG